MTSQAHSALISQYGQEASAGCWQYHVVSVLLFAIELQFLLFLLPIFILKSAYDLSSQTDGVSRLLAFEYSRSRRHLIDNSNIAVRYFFIQNRA